MKKLIIGGLLALVFVSPLGASATTTPITQEDLNSQLLVIINSLMVQVQDLMKQLIAMQTQQAKDSQAIQTVVERTTPAPVVVGATVSVPIGPSISFGEPTCSGSSAVVPFTVYGSGWKYGAVHINTPNGWSGGTNFTSSDTREFWIGNNNGTTTLTTEFGNSKTGSPHYAIIPTHTQTDTIFVGNVCQ